MIKNILWIAAMTSLAAYLVLRPQPVEEQSDPFSPFLYEEYCSQHHDDPDWTTFIEALAWKESRCNPAAVGGRDDVGYLQITPTIIRDANRILGREAYTLEDRLSKEVSIEIFNIIQDEYNPEHDLNLALKIWNPKAPLSYHTDVISRYEYLRERKTVDI